MPTPAKHHILAISPPRITLSGEWRTGDTGYVQEVRGTLLLQPEEEAADGGTICKYVYLFGVKGGELQVGMRVIRIGPGDEEIDGEPKKGEAPVPPSARPWELDTCRGGYQIRDARGRRIAYVQIETAWLGVDRDPREVEADVALLARLLHSRIGPTYPTPWMHRTGFASVVEVKEPPMPPPTEALQWQPDDRADTQGTCDYCGKNTRPLMFAFTLFIDGRIRDVCFKCYNNPVLKAAEAPDA